MSLHIAPLRPEDRAAWETLARGYKAFYETEVSPAGYDTAWQRLLQRDGVFGLGAHDDGQLVGITHYLFHTSTWSPRLCYLQDLFTAPEMRGRGVAHALIAAVGEAAHAANATRCYWLTHERNATARTLYDKVAQFHGFIRYDLPLQEIA
jgi:GNAT superfamily N-acetyltransferase